MADADQPKTSPGNVHSQSGEDAVIGRILSVIGRPRDGWCVEFGAWDGIYNSNTWNLVRNHGYQAVLIEGSQAKFEELQRNMAGRPVTPVHAFVEVSGESTLDRILQRTAIPADFDLLSIDIDGNDYHVWESVSAYRPKVVVIEFNPTIPNEVDFVQPLDPRLNHGASAAAMVRLGKAKGYELVATTVNNAFLVRADLFPQFAIADNSLWRLRTDLSRVTWLFSGYDGTVFVRGSCNLDLHGLPFSERRMQLLPAWLRGFDDTRGGINGLKRQLRRIYKSLRKRGLC